MKKYIGTKQIMAEPMNELVAVLKGFVSYNDFFKRYARADHHRIRDEYNAQLRKGVPATDITCVGVRDGYHVQYTNPDGTTYDSWSPREVFETAYHPAETPFDRMKIEHDELTDKVQKLTAFIANPFFNRLHGATQHLLREQLTHMSNYLFTLKERMKLMQ
jgi:hypothetical protein